MWAPPHAHLARLHLPLLHSLPCRPDAAGVIDALIGFAATLRDSLRASAVHSAPEQAHSRPEQPTAHQAPSGQTQ